MRLVRDRTTKALFNFLTLCYVHFRHAAIQYVFTARLRLTINEDMIINIQLMLHIQLLFVHNQA
jgi:hypothetical protein